MFTNGWRVKLSILINCFSNSGSSSGVHKWLERGRRPAFGAAPTCLTRSFQDNSKIPPRCLQVQDPSKIPSRYLLDTSKIPPGYLQDPYKILIKSFQDTSKFLPWFLQDASRTLPGSLQVTPGALGKYLRMCHTFLRCSRVREMPKRFVLYKAKGQVVTISEHKRKLGVLSSI